jgi:hypothetical protein
MEDLVHQATTVAFQVYQFQQALDAGERGAVRSHTREGMAEPAAPELPTNKQCM